MGLRNKKYYVLSVVLYIILCYLLYFFQYKMYGGAINTVYLSFIFVPILVILFSSGKKEVGEQKEDENKVRRRSIWNKFMLVTSLFLFIYNISDNIYQLCTFYLYLFIWFMVSCCVIFGVDKLYPSLKNKIVEPMGVALIFLTIIIATATYPIIIHPATVKDAAQTLAQEGYRQIEYTGVADKAYGDNSKEGSLDFYEFTGKFGDKARTVQVSVLEGSIVSYKELE